MSTPKMIDLVAIEFTSFVAYN